MTGLLNDIENLLPDGVDVTTLTKQELIRIEKQLKSQAKLDDSIDLNQIQDILRMLNNHGEGLAILYQKKYAPLRRILKKPEEGYCIGVNPIRDLTAEPALNDLLENGFQNDLKRYVDTCFKENHFTGLYTLLQYENCFDIQLKDQIIQYCKDKLDFATELLYIQTWEKMESRLEAVMNPYLFRCLNRLGSFIFANHIHYLLESTIAYQGTEVLKMRILFAMGSYKAVNEEFAEVIHNNHHVAYEQGIREKSFNSVVQGKGGTFKRTAFDQRSYETLNRPREKSKRSGSEGLRAVGILLFIGFMVFRIFLNSNNNSYEAPDYDFSSLFENIDMSTPVEYGFNMDADLDFVKAVNYIQSDSALILSNEPVEFGQNLNAYFESDRLTPYEGKPDQVKVVNETNQDLILFFQGDLLYKKAFLFLGPENFEWISGDLAGFRIYTGDSPEMVEYRADTTQRNYREGFRWGEFSDENRKHFNVYRDLGLSLFPGEKVELTISFKDGQFIHEVDKTTLFEGIDL
jgi:hypothetical protein